MAAYEKDKGRRLFEKLIDLYMEYGFYKEDLISITKKGMDGQQQIAAMMEGYRNNPPKSINGSDVVELLDYELQKGKNLKTGENGRSNYQNPMCCSLSWPMAARSQQGHAVLSQRSNSISVSIHN